MGGKLGVDVFVLISGYFLVSSKGVKTEKVLKLWLQIFFYSVLLFAVFVICSETSFGVKGLIKRVFPLTFEQWWFASTYFVMYLFSPFLNILLHKLDRAAYTKLLVLTTILWCVLPTFTLQSYESNNLLWFFYLYIVAGYIKLWQNNTGRRAWPWMLAAAAMASVTYLSAVVFDIIGLKIPFFGENATGFYGQQKLPIVLLALFLFLGFKNLRLGQRKSINFVAAAMFGVYLIHDDNYVRLFLWKTLFHNIDRADSPYLILYAFAEIVLVFVVCTVIELVRIWALEKQYMRVVRPIAKWIDKKLDQLFHWKIFRLS